MKFKNIVVFSALLAALCVPSFASFTTYSQTISTSTSSLAITEATHGIASKWLGVSVEDGSGNVLAPSLYSYSVNASTYEVDLNFSPSISSGKVIIVGGFPSATSASTDFQVTGAGTASLTVCQYCTKSVPAQRADAGGKGWVLAEPVVFTITWQATGYIGILGNVYLNPSTNQVVLGYAGPSATVTCTPAAYCSVQSGISAFPSGTIPLGSSLSSGSTALWGTVTDNRPTQFQ